MAVGYEGWAKLNVNGTEDLVLCTGASVPLNRIRIDSSSGYGGQIKTPANQIGIGMPHVYDWSGFDGSINFEVTEDLITNQIKPWIFDRQKAGQVTIKPRMGANNYHSECFWNSINLSTSGQSLIEGSLGFVAVDLGTYAMGAGYTSNKTGDGYLCSPGGLNIPDPVISNVAVPFWKSFVTIDGSSVPFLSWSVDFSQDVVKFFTCENNVNPIEPKFLAVGPMTVTFNAEYMIVETAPWLMPDDLATLNVTIGGVVLKMKRCELISFRDDVASGDSAVPINVEYACYEIES